MLISRLPFGGGGEMHGAIISVTFSSDFIGGKCTLENPEGMVIQEKNITNSLILSFNGLMEAGKYKITAYVADKSKSNNNSIDITLEDIFNQTVFSIYLALVKIVTFADGTDEEIGKMLEAHYNGWIDIADYWSVGDERVIHLTQAQKILGISEKIAEQDATIVIADINHYDLTTPINEKTKSAIVCVFKYALYGATPLTYANQPVRLSYANESAGGTAWRDPSHANWEVSASRNYCNNIFYNECFSEFMKNTIKPVNILYKTDGSKGTSAYVKTVSDKVFYLSYTEMTTDINNTLSGYVGLIGLEGEQLELFKVVTNIGIDSRYNKTGKLVSRSRSGYSNYSSDGTYYYNFNSTVANNGLARDRHPAYTDNTISTWPLFFPAFCL